jgi:pimeloyl-ACP methyl ester carboxylesterase
MDERPLFFASGTHRLFGMYHAPDTTAAPAARPAVVFCHPFGEEKLWAHRVYVNGARALARRGYPVLRFDARGHGDSSGPVRDYTIDGALEDGDAAVAQARQLSSATQVILIGLRLGGTLAGLLAERRPDVSAIVQWAPIVDGARYMQELLRVNLATQMAIYKEIRADRAALVATLQGGDTVNVDGYAVGLGFYDGLMPIKHGRQPARFAGRSLVVQIDPRPGMPALAELQQLAASYRHGTYAAVEEDPFWKEIPRFYDDATRLMPATIAWLEEAPA